jgi:transcription elongation GreA/GreB family factor
MEVQASDPRKHGDLKALTEDPHRAVIVDPKDVFSDVITMNWREDLVDLDNGETVTYTLVFPRESNVEEERFPCSRRSARECRGTASAMSSGGRCQIGFAT